MTKSAVLEQDWKYPWKYIALKIIACVISIITGSNGYIGTDLILELMFTNFLYQMKTATLNVVAEGI